MPVYVRFRPSFPISQTYLVISSGDEMRSLDAIQHPREDARCLIAL